MSSKRKASTRLSQSDEIRVSSRSNGRGRGSARGRGNTRSRGNNKTVTNLSSNNSDNGSDEVRQPLNSSQPKRNLIKRSSDSDHLNSRWLDDTH